MGSLKLARDPKFQALFAFRGMPANSWNLTPEQTIGPKGNAEYTKLSMVLGGGIRDKFNLSQLRYNKIIAASDADVDGYGIRALIMTHFYLNYYPIIEAGLLYIAEPPLYKVDDKKNPFIVNKMEYTTRYCNEASKKYKIGIEVNGNDFEWIKKDKLLIFLGDTRYYVEDLQTIGEHYLMNDRLLEIILTRYSEILPIPNDPVNAIDIDVFMNTINEEFPELYYDYKRNVIIGSIDGKPQTVHITSQMLKRAHDEGIMELINKYKLPNNQKYILHSLSTKTDQHLSMLEMLKILRKFQPNIIHRFKGLGENDVEDIRTTIMDPNTRSLIQVKLSDFENDNKMLQMLRGNTTIDRMLRRESYLNFKIDRDTIDT